MHFHIVHAIAPFSVRMLIYLPGAIHLEGLSTEVDEFFKMLEESLIPDGIFIH